MNTLIALPLFFSSILALTAQPNDSVLAFNIAAGDFDTGVAVSNAGTTGGTLSFKLFADNEQGGKREILIESQALAANGTGSGLNIQGVLAAGGTYTVLASELATAAGLSGYTGQIVVQASFENARAVNFVFNNSLGSAHGYPAGPLTAPQTAFSQTFWGRADCPAIEGFEPTRLLTGITYTAVGLSGGGVGGFICAPQTISGGQIIPTGVQIRPVTTQIDGAVVQCAVCLYR